MQIQTVEPFICLLDIPRGTLSRFSQGNRPVWSPDGARIAFQSARHGFSRLYWQRVGANEPAELLFKSNEAQNIVDWSRDGRFIVFSSQSPTNARDVWILTTDCRRTATPLLRTPAQERNGAISPAGKWFTYESDEDGRIAVFVRSFPGPGRAFRVSTMEGSLPFWRDDGREIYYRASGQLFAVAFDASGGSPSLGAPTALFPLQSPVASQLRARTDAGVFWP
jgi:eukaryotic-like serine/threonine-protein kinase